MTFTYSLSPGRMSIFEQQLRAGLYRRAGLTRVGGRVALKLVPAHRVAAPVIATYLRRRRHSGAHERLGTVYVTPRSHNPIEEVIQGGFVESWLTYRVLPATAGSLRLVSLTARHPTATIVHGAEAYLGAQAAQASRPVRIRPDFPVIGRPPGRPTRSR